MYDRALIECLAKNSQVFRAVWIKALSFWKNKPPLPIDNRVRQMQDWNTICYRSSEYGHIAKSCARENGVSSTEKKSKVLMILVPGLQRMTCILRVKICKGATTYEAMGSIVCKGRPDSLLLGELY